MITFLKLIKNTIKLIMIIKLYLNNSLSKNLKLLIR
jgi:hypothetical protein